MVVVVVADDDDDRRETSEEDTEDKKKRTREDRRGVVVVTKNSVFPARKPVFATTVRMRSLLFLSSLPARRCYCFFFGICSTSGVSFFLYLFFERLLAKMWKKSTSSKRIKIRARNLFFFPRGVWMMMMMMRRMLALSNRLHARLVSASACSLSASASPPPPPLFVREEKEEEEKRGGKKEPEKEEEEEEEEVGTPETFCLCAQVKINAKIRKDRGHCVYKPVVVDDIVRAKQKDGNLAKRAHWYLLFFFISYVFIYFLDFVVFITIGQRWTLW